MGWEFDHNEGLAHRIVEWFENQSAKRQILEFLSTGIIALTAVGFIIGIAFPGPSTGAILPAALILWVALFSYIKRQKI